MKTEANSSTHLTRGYTIAVTSAIILSTTAIFIRYLTQTYAVPALILAFWRDVFVVATLVPALALIRPGLLRVRRQDLVYLLIYGLVLAAFNSLWTISVAWNGAAVATVMVYCSAGFTALLGWWLLKEHLDGVKLLAVAASLGGCVLVADVDFTAWHSSIGGVLVGIGAGLLYAIYSLLGRSAAQRGINPWTTLLYTFGFASIWLLAANLLSPVWLPEVARRPADLLWLQNSLMGWGALILLAAGPTVAGFGLYNVSLSHLPSSVANLIVTMEPAFTAVMAYLLFGERLGTAQMIGALIILSGVVILRVHESRLANQVRWQERAGNL